MASAEAEVVVYRAWMSLWKNLGLQLLSWRYSILLLLLCVSPALSFHAGCLGTRMLARARATRGVYPGAQTTQAAAWFRGFGRAWRGLKFVVVRVGGRACARRTQFERLSRVRTCLFPMCLCLDCHLRTRMHA